MAEYTLTQADSGSSFELSPGDLLVIRLPENPTTGFRWATDQGNDEILELQGSNDYASMPSTGIGGGGERVFTYRAKKAGIVQLTLKLWRDWLGDASILERFQTTLLVRA